LVWDVQELFRRHGRQLTRFLNRRVQCPDLAADLAQETFLRLLGAAPVGAIGNGQAYLFRTAANLAVDHQRRQRLLPLIDDPEALQAVADDSPTPERVVLSRRELAAVEAALEDLPERTRDVFILARVEGLTYQAIGRRLNIPTQTAYSHMVRALCHLKARLDQGR